MTQAERQDHYRCCSVCHARHALWQRRCQHCDSRLESIERIRTYDFHRVPSYQIGIGDYGRGAEVAYAPARYVVTLDYERDGVLDKRGSIAEYPTVNECVLFIRQHILSDMPLDAE